MSERGERFVHWRVSEGEMSERGERFVHRRMCVYVCVCMYVFFLLFKAQTL